MVWKILWPALCEGWAMGRGVAHIVDHSLFNSIAIVLTNTKGLLAQSSVAVVGTAALFWSNGIRISAIGGISAI